MTCVCDQAKNGPGGKLYSGTGHTPPTPGEARPDSGATAANLKRSEIMNNPCTIDELQADQCTITDAFGLEDRDANEVRDVASYIHSLEQENAALRQRIALLRGIPQLA